MTADALLATQREALRELRSLLGRFVRAEIDVSEFLPRYRRLFAPFDPPDLTTADLSLDECKQVDVFICLMGGWFGEQDELIPRRSDWVYGTDTAPHGWIDANAYRALIRSRLTAAGIEV